MTNILAAIVVALVTNVSEQVGIEGTYYLGGSIISPALYYSDGERFEMPKTKTVTTTVIEVITATFDMDGERVVTKRETEKSRTVKTYREKTEWEEVRSTPYGYDGDDELTNIDFGDIIVHGIITGTIKGN